MKEDLELRLRLGVPGHDNVAAVCCGKMDVYHLDGAKLFQAGAGRQSGRQIAQAPPERHYSEAREKLATILEESKTEEVVIRRRKGDTYAIVPQSPRRRRSPFDVPALNKRLTKEEIIEAIRESRERA